jgi:hypothetical protein
MSKPLSRRSRDFSREFQTSIWHHPAHRESAIANPCLRGGDVIAAKAGIRRRRLTLPPSHLTQHYDLAPAV